MKNILTILFTFLCFNSFATSYYFSSSTGNDITGTGSISQPWASLAKASSVFASHLPGDFLLFKRGDSFYGELIISRSGSAGLPITISDYGTGAKPIFTGFTSVTTWSNLGGNIWETTTAISTLPTCNMVVIGGVNTAMGRTPNYPAYYVYQTMVAQTSITSTNLNSAVANWSGAEVAMFTTTYRVARHPITGQTGSTLNFSTAGNVDNVIQTPSTYFIPNFHIQNDPRTLDVQNEWYYNPTTKKLRIYSAGMPANVQMATKDTLVWTGIGKDWITFRNISFTGSNKNAIELGTSKQLKVIACDFNYIGYSGLYGPSWGQTLPGLRVDSCTFNNMNDCGMDVSRWFTQDTIRYNYAKNTGLLIGMGRIPTASSMGTGLFTQGAFTEMSWNRTDSTCLMGLRFFGTGTQVHHNYVQNFCKGNGVKDGGGIYSFNNGDSAITNSRVSYNIVDRGTPVSQGIYMDDGVVGQEIDHNFSTGSQRGIYVHNGDNIYVHDNLSYNNDYQFLMGNARDTTPTFLRFYKNVWFSKLATQYSIYLDPAHRINLALLSDSNYFVRPIDDNLTISVAWMGKQLKQNLAQWTGLSDQDQNSKKSPATITSVGQLFSAYNPTDHDSTVVIPAGTWIDVYSNFYFSNILLHSFTGVVLMTTTNVPPVANAGTNKNITLPTTSVTQVGSGTDADGTIVAYQWTAFSGPATPTFGSATSATTTINGMSVAGTYVIQLKVTDNAGLTATDTASIIVNSTPPVNIPPTANAGGNKSITLPTSTVTQVGSGTDPDGTITGYNWTQTGGPVSATIVSPTSATTVINGLTVSGVYSFSLRVTDNNGATGTATATITVIPAANVNPTANAGSDQAITYPNTTVSLSGSGSDADGSIIAYNWTKISGPTPNIITSPNSAATTVTGLTIGVYQFQLQVTDNSGGTGADVVQVTVNQGTVSFTVTNTVRPWTGSNLLPTVITSPASVPYSITLDGVTGGKSAVGTYTYIIGPTDAGYTGSATGSFRITKDSSVVINATSDTVNYDGNLHSIVATTTPAGVTGLTYLYNDISVSGVSAIGVYDVAIGLNNVNRWAPPINRTLTIVNNPAPIFISDTLFIYDGTVKNVTVTSAFTYSLVYSPGGHTAAGTYTAIATITQVGHSGADTAIVVIQKQPAVLGWNPIAPKPAGSQLTTLDLNATSNVAGTFSYSPTVGYIPGLGVTGITATFTPTDPANYQGGTVTNTVSVFGENPFLNFYIIGPGGVIYIKQ